MHWTQDGQQFSGRIVLATRVIGSRSEEDMIGKRDGWEGHRISRADEVTRDELITGARFEVEDYWRIENILLL